MSVEFPEGEKCVLCCFISSVIWQKPDLETSSAGCFRSCNYRFFLRSCLFHAFNHHTDGLNHCQPTTHSDRPQSFWIAGKALEWLEGQMDVQTAWKLESILVEKLLI